MNDLNWKHLFAIERSRRYHLRRAGFHTTCDRISAFALIVLGTAVMADFAALATAIGMFVAVIGAAQIVFRFSDQARDHRELAKQFSALLAEIKSSPAPTAQQAEAWERRRLEIETVEPPVFCAVEADVYNEVMLAYGVTATRRHIPWWAFPIMHFVRLESLSFAQKPEPAPA